MKQVLWRQSTVPLGISTISFAWGCIVRYFVWLEMVNESTSSARFVPRMLMNLSWPGSKSRQNAIVPASRVIEGSGHYPVLFEKNLLDGCSFRPAFEEYLKIHRPVLAGAPPRRFLAGSWLQLPRGEVSNLLKNIVEHLQVGFRERLKVGWFAIWLEGRAADLAILRNFGVILRMFVFPVESIQPTGRDWSLLQGIVAISGDRSSVPQQVLFVCEVNDFAEFLLGDSRPPRRKVGHYAGELPRLEGEGDHCNIEFTPVVRQAQLRPQLHIRCATACKPGRRERLCEWPGSSPVLFLFARWLRLPLDAVIGRHGARLGGRIGAEIRPGAGNPGGTIPPRLVPPHAHPRGPWDESVVD